MISTTFITPLTSMPTVSSLDKDSNNLSSNEENSELSFFFFFRQKIQNVKDLEQKSLDSAYAVSMGQTEDIEGAMIDATRASVAIETAVQITTRAVNAYKEIVQMQI